MFRNRSVDVHKFAMIPRADIPRSAFRIEKTHKTTCDSGWLIPIYVDEVLPGDTFNLRMTSFGRLATPIVPIMDNIHLDSFFFFVPNRLVWENWQRFQGEQDNPDDSTSFLIPQITWTGGYNVGSIYDHMGLPTVGQVDPAGEVSHSALFLRAYNLIWNEWFRDENLQDSVPVPIDDGPDDANTYTVLKRGKRHDYFTSCLPWPQKGPSVPLALGGTAPVIPNGPGARPILQSPTGAASAGSLHATGEGTNAGKVWFDNVTAADALLEWNTSGLVTDLGAATAATINQLRQSFQIQRVLERDARGGTRYTEIVRAHFGVVSPDARLQRPEYLGGGSARVAINPVAQTSATEETSTPQGHLSAIGTFTAGGHGFSQSFTEHGMIIGLISIRADLTYQQGLRRMWSRRTRFDFYLPAFAALGEQAVLRKEIYCTGVEANDDEVFGYQERWAEYRYNPSEITGMFRSTAAGTIDVWHLAQNFTTAPTLGPDFIEESPPIPRVLAVGAEALGQEFLVDCFFSAKVSRPMPMYSVPGLIDHF